MNFPGYFMQNGVMVPAQGDEQTSTTIQLPGPAPPPKEKEVSEDEDLSMSEDEDEQVPVVNTRDLMDSLPKEQVARFEMFKRAHLTRTVLKKLLNSILSMQVNNNTLIVVSSAAKLFVAEITEIGRQIMVERGETGSLSPEHLREALRQYNRKKPILKRKRLF